MANNINQYKFSEGEVYSFTITGFTEIPGTDESFYILKNPFGGKHLLKAIHYKHYNLKTGQQINCKIDKINCSGKIFLEPENPKYKEGKTYEFELLKIIDHINSVGQKEKAALVKDLFNNELICSLPPDYDLDPNKEKINCKVLRIKKGQLFLAIPEYHSNSKTLTIGENYWFTITDVKKLHSLVDYYILKDEYGNLYSLKKDMYQHYGFKIGHKVECTVTKYHTDAQLKIEPVHPYYEVGKTYSFKYLRNEKDTNPLEKEENVIVVEDIFGVETKVRSSDSVNLTGKKPAYIECKVEGIRKGKAILALNQEI